MSEIKNEIFTLIASGRRQIPLYPKLAGLIEMVIAELENMLAAGVRPLSQSLCRSLVYWNWKTNGATFFQELAEVENKIDAYLLSKEAT